MNKFMVKFRFLTALLALCLSGHYVSLAVHLSCHVHPYCEDDFGQVFGSASGEEHDHCLVKITPSREPESSKENFQKIVLNFVSVAHGAPEIPRVLTATGVLQSLVQLSTPGSQFTRYVRIIS